MAAGVGCQRPLRRLPFINHNLEESSRMSTDNASVSRAFEVHGTLNLGYKPQTDKKTPRELDLRTTGATVTEDELRGVGMTDADLESLLTSGTISDPDAPTRPSLAPLYAAHNFASRLAKHFGLLTQRGAEFTFGGEKFNGTAAFRDGVSLERLETALRTAWDEVTE
jgi:hypothetical protein